MNSDLDTISYSLKREELMNAKIRNMNFLLKSKKIADDEMTKKYFTDSEREKLDKLINKSKKSVFRGVR